MIQIMENKRVDVKNKMSKSLVVLFLVLALCFGIDLGFLEFINKKYRFLAQIVSYVMKVLYTLSMLCTLLERFEYNFGDAVNSDFLVLFEFLTFLFFWTITIQCILYSVILVTEKYTSCNFIIDLHIIDGKISFYPSETFCVLSIVYVLGLFFTKVVMTFNSCELIVRSDCRSILGVIKYLYFHTPIFCIDTVALEVFLVYYNLYRFIKLTRESYENSQDDVKVLQYRYISAANCFDKIRPHYDRILLIGLLLELPKLLGLLWGTLVYIKLQAPWEVYAADYFSASHVIFQIILPAWIAEKINTQINDIKFLLHDRLIQNTDDNPEIVRLLRYLDARPLNQPVWGVIPVDLRLPVALFSVFTTYFIVIVQFTHVYD